MIMRKKKQIVKLTNGYLKY